MESEDEKKDFSQDEMSIEEDIEKLAANQPIIDDYVKSDREEAHEKMAQEIAKLQYQNSLIGYMDQELDLIQRIIMYNYKLKLSKEQMRVLETRKETILQDKKDLMREDQMRETRRQFGKY